MFLFRHCCVRRQRRNLTALDDAAEKAKRHIRSSLLKRPPRLTADPLKARFIVFDTETTGLLETNRIVEIAAVEMIGPEETGRSFHAYANPGMPIPRDAIEVDEITDQTLAEAPNFADVAPRFFDLLGERCWLVAHHAEFDAGMLNRELRRIGHIARIAEERVLCTLQLASSPRARHCLQVFHGLGFQPSWTNARPGGNLQPEIQGILTSRLSGRIWTAAAILRVGAISVCR